MAKSKTAEKEVKTKKPAAKATAEKATKTKTAAKKPAAKSAKAEKEVKAKKPAAKTSTKAKAEKPAAKATKSSKAAKPAKAEKASKSSKSPIIKDKLTATQLVVLIAERADTDNKTVKNVLAASQEVVVEHLRKGAVGSVKLLGYNFKSVAKPAVKGGEKKPNPFKKGEFIITKPKPASMRLRVLPLKAIKDAVAA